MFNNAFLYNDQGSLVYEDAARLKALFLFYTGKGPDPNSPTALPALGNVTLVDEITDKVTGEVYRVGDWVYIPPARTEGLSTSSTVCLVVQVWRDNIEGDKLGFTGCWFLRPEQTMHKATHVFMENEVFQTHHMIHYSVAEISGRAVVLHIRDYVRGKPKGYDVGDVYVCESKYVEPGKVYQKLKGAEKLTPEGIVEREVPLELYETPIVPKKVPSIWHEQAAPKDKGKKRKSSVGMDDVVVVDKATKVWNFWFNSQSTKVLKKESPGKAISGFPNLSNSTSRSSLAPLHAIPQHMTQSASAFPRAVSLPISESLDEGVRREFDQFGNGLHSVKWFGAPPGPYGAEGAGALHSLDYLVRERNQVEEQPAVTMEGVEVDKREDVVEVLGVRLEVDESVPGVEEVWAPVNDILNGLADTWLQAASLLSH